MMKEKIRKITINILFPILLVAFALIGCNRGVDLSDTTYSVGNYIFFKETSGAWLYATYLANLCGYGLIRLFGTSMFVLNAVSACIPAGLALMIYFCFKKDFPAGWVFLGELIALGCCWTPTVILYNYLTILLFGMASLFLWKAAKTEQRKWRILAGVCLGINVLVRISNLAEVALIVVVWVHAFRAVQTDTTQKGRIVKDTLDCILGYILGLLCGGIVFAASSLTGASKGENAISSALAGIAEMKNWLLGLLSGSAEGSGYSFSEMFAVLFNNYLGNLKWLLFGLTGVLLGCIMFSVAKEKFLRGKQVLYAAGIVLLIVFYYKNGILTLRYYDTSSIFSITAMGMILVIAVAVFELANKKATGEIKDLAVLGLTVLLITPLGTNNHLYSNMNNLFIVAPVGILLFADVMKNIKKESVYAFPLKAMVYTFFVIHVVQAILFGAVYVFRDGEGGEKADYRMSEGTVFDGMMTTQEKGEQIEEFYLAAKEEAWGESESALYYGNIPGCAYLLNIPPAISTTWPDLDSYGLESFRKEIGENDVPVVIVPAAMGAYLMEDAEGILILTGEKGSGQSEQTERLIRQYEEDEKLSFLKGFMEQRGYDAVYISRGYVVFKAGGM